jgi:hypothetical protein
MKRKLWRVGCDFASDVCTCVGLGLIMAASAFGRVAYDVDEG